MNETERPVPTKPLKFIKQTRKASLDGRKTQTRRPIDPQPDVFPCTWNLHEWPSSEAFRRDAWRFCPYGWPGDVFQIGGVDFVITNVRPDRLQNITEEDAKADGVTVPLDAVMAAAVVHDTPARLEFWHLWISIYGVESMKLNPWVWVITYYRVFGLESLKIELAKLESYHTNVPAPPTTLTQLSAFPVYWKLFGMLGIQERERFFNSDPERRAVRINDDFFRVVRWMPTLESGWRRLAYIEFCAWYGINK
ncbi:MAG: hypothetical protein R3B95_11750 [Nitrospirales bacterium]|nr:hypothetical protein [Nitrospirales bacterium]